MTNTCLTRHISDTSVESAPDGSTVRPLARLASASLAQFRFAAGSTSRAVRHRTVDELWFIVEGSGELWRELAGEPATCKLTAGLSLAIEHGVGFQVRVSGDQDLVVIGTTTPPWPHNEAEALPVNGHWPIEAG